VAQQPPSHQPGPTSEPATKLTRSEARRLAKRRRFGRPAKSTGAEAIGTPESSQA
jgi:hypothetical protein